MLKMLLDPMGGIVMTNDGNAILREIDVAHPAAKSMIELSRNQDEEVGDGTTSVIILGKCATMKSAVKFHPSHGVFVLCTLLGVVLKMPRVSLPLRDSTVAGTASLLCSWRDAGGG